MPGQWIERDALITVKAYPNPSVKHYETVCVAAITRDEGWIRLYPVQFRTLPENRQFKKYQRVRLRMTKHRSDTASTPDEIKSLIRQKYLGELCASDRDTHFFVGNLNSHRASFMVLGVYWPLKRKHDLFD